MNWATIALLSAAILGVVNIFDSHLISRRMPSLRGMLFVLAIMYIPYALLSFFLFPFPEKIGVVPILVAILSGIFRCGAIIIMLYIMKREEVSRVVPVVYTYPIFVAILAVPLLGESLHFLQWLAVIVVVSGAILVSLRQSESGSNGWVSKSFFLLLGASFLLALGDITGKYALEYISFWNMFSVVSFCFTAFFLMFSTSPSVLRQIRDMKGKKTAFSLMALNETLAPIAIVLSFRALEIGPVSLVSTITSTRPIFVVIYALLVSLVFPGFLHWHTSRKTLVLRVIGTAMTVGGIAIIYLT